LAWAWHTLLCTGHPILDNQKIKEGKIDKINIDRQEFDIDTC